MEEMKMLLVLGAMDGEIEEFAAAMELHSSLTLPGGGMLRIGSLDGQPLALCRSGVGKVLSALICQASLTGLENAGLPPDALVFTGLAGAINPELKIGDTLLASDCIQHDLDATALGIPRGTVPYSQFRFFPADPQLLAAASGYKPREGRVFTGRVLTGDQFIHQRDDGRYSYLRGELEGDAVEMEGAAVAQCAALYGLPFLLIRTISDEADGKARVKFKEFLPRASRNSLHAVRHLISELRRI